MADLVKVTFLKSFRSFSANEGPVGFPPAMAERLIEAGIAKPFEGPTAEATATEKKRTAKAAKTAASRQPKGASKARRTTAASGRGRRKKGR